jgi:hypothetical protein
MAVKYVDQMANNYDKIFHCKNLPILPNFGFLGLKINHLATLIQVIPKKAFIHSNDCYSEETSS